MGFVKVVNPSRERCACKKPSSNNAKYFSPGTIWVCDDCGAAWEFEKVSYGDQRDPGQWDIWKRANEHDGPDNRPVPQIAKVDKPAKRIIRACICDYEIVGAHSRACLDRMAAG